MYGYLFTKDLDIFELRYIIYKRINQKNKKIDIFPLKKFLSKKDYVSIFSHMKIDKFVTVSSWSSHKEDSAIVVVIHKAKRAIYTDE